MATSKTAGRRIPRHIQDKVDKYIELDEQVKQMQADLRKLRKSIEPYMMERGIPRINGTVRGSIQLETRNMAVITGKYTTYDLDLIAPILSDEARKQCIVPVIDRDILDLLVKTKKVPPEVQEAKIINQVTAFVIEH